MDITYLPLLALLINLFVGIIIFVRGAKYTLARHFFALCVTMAIWALLDFLSISATDKESAWWFGGIRTIASISAVTTLFHFSLRVTDHPVDKNRWYPFFIYLPIVVIGYLRLNTTLFASGMQMLSYGYDIVAGQLYIVPVAYGFLLSIATLFILTMQLRKERDPIKASQLKYIIAGASMPLLSSALVYTVLPMLGINVKFLASIFVAAIPVIIGISISQNQLLMPFSLFAGSIRSKIFSISVLSTFIIILPGIFFIYSSSKTNIYSQLEQQISLIIEQHQETVEAYFKNTFQNFTVLSKRTELSELLLSEDKSSDSASYKNAKEELLRIAQTFDQINTISLIDTNGKVVISSANVQSVPLSRFKHITKSTFSKIERQQDKLVYYLVSPIADDNNRYFIGYLISEFNADHLYEQLHNFHGSTLTSTLYLTDQTNILISPIKDYDNELVLSQRMPETVQSICNLQSTHTAAVPFSITKYIDFTGNNVLGAASQLNSMPWCLVLEVNESEATQPLRNILLTALLISLFSIVAITIISEWLGKIISSPIIALEASTKIVSQGDYSHKVAINTNDEIGALSKAFDQMTTSLKESRETINEQVQEQTKDLVQQKDALVRQQKQMVTILTELEDEKEKSDLLASDLEKFQRAVANASDHIVITDQDGYIVYANASVERITGFKPDEILGQKAGSKQNWGGQMSPAFYKKMWNIIKVQKSSFSGEVTNMHKNGEKYNVFATITPIFNKDDEVQFYLGIERDITKEKEIDQAKTEFVSLASHQLRTPLSAINWYTEMLLEGDAGKLNEEQRNYLMEIYAGNQRMVDLVTSLLNVSRLELGTFTIEPEPFQINDLAADAIKELHPLISTKSIQLNTEFAKMPLINVDKKLTYIIFQNLLSNAFKYTPNGGSVLLKIQKKGIYATITIADTGMGIPKEQQPHIFEKLFRASNAKESVTEGTGLGLYIIKSILDHTGGKIDFSSEIGKGSTFTVKIPLKGMRKKKGTKRLEIK
jgi:PAS domain S-box-containing protein